MINYAGSGTLKKKLFTTDKKNLWEKDNAWHKAFHQHLRCCLHFIIKKRQSSTDIHLYALCLKKILLFRHFYNKRYSATKLNGLYILNVFNFSVHAFIYFKNNFKRWKINDKSYYVQSPRKLSVVDDFARRVGLWVKSTSSTQVVS